MDGIALAALVLVVSYIVVFYAASVLRMACTRLGKNKPLARVHVSLNPVLTDDCGDCDYYLLWETQQPALEFLRSAGSRGATAARMTEFYRNFVRLYPELCDGSSFADWLAALEEADVIACEGATVTITEKGRFILALLSGETRTFLQSCPEPYPGKTQ